MKRFFALLLVLCSFCACSFASEDPFECLTDEQVLLISQMAHNELITRGYIKSAVVPQGVYIVGVDLPSGTYSVSHEGSVSTVEVYPSAASQDDIYDYTIYDDEIIGRIVLEDGQRLEVKHKPVFLTVYSGLSFK